MQKTILMIMAVVALVGCGKKVTTPNPKTEPSDKPLQLDTRSLQNGLIAHYKFDGKTHDSTGNSKKGDIIGGASTAGDRHGNPEKCYDFNVGGYMILGNADGLALKEFTTSVWFKWRSNHPDHIYRTLLAKGQGVYLTHMNYMIQVADTDGGVAGGKLIAVVGKGKGPPDDSSATVWSSDDKVTDGSWHHTAFTFSSGTGVGNLYLDGKLVDSKSDIPPAFINENQDATIGIWGGFERSSKLFPQNGVDYGVWDGLIDDLRIYNRPLTEEEVKTLYKFEK